MHQDIRLLQQTIELRPVVGLLQVECHAALAAVPARGRRRLAKRRSLLRFHLDHVGASLGEKERRHRAGMPRREIDDA